MGKARGCGRGGEVDRRGPCPPARVRSATLRGEGVIEAGEEEPAFDPTGAPVRTFGRPSAIG